MTGPKDGRDRLPTWQLPVMGYRLPVIARGFLVAQQHPRDQ